VSIKRNADGFYWNGTIFTGTTETFNGATALGTPNGTSTTWRYTFALPGDGGYTIHVQAADTLGNAQTGTTYAATSVFTIDTAAPTAVDIQTTNKTGGTNGLAEQGDIVTYTFSETMNPASIVSGWTGTALNVTIHLDRSGNGDVFLTVKDGSDATALNMGSVDLGRSDLLASTGTKHATFSASSMVQSGSNISITVGTFNGDAVGTAGGTGTMVWSPSASATDSAGNAMSTTARNEQGTLDKDF
jgi:hypothetical protein